MLFVRCCHLFNPFMLYVLRLGPTFEELFSGAKVLRKAQKIGVGHKTAYEIDPWVMHGTALFLPVSPSVDISKKAEK